MLMMGSGSGESQENSSKMLHEDSIIDPKKGKT
jgi:hypothetical protein